MKQAKLLELLCRQNGFSYIIFNKDFRVIEANNINLQNNSDVREYLYEITGMEDTLLALKPNEDIQIPMILREGTYYDLRIEATQNENEQLFVAYLQTQSLEVVQYTHALRSINKKTLQKELAQMNDTLHQQILQTLNYASEHDTLTSLANRHAFLKQTDVALEKQGSLFVCFVDIDHFHTINNEYGSHAGDMLLKHLVDIINKTKEKKDFFARIYADTFALLLNNNDQNYAKQLQRIIELQVKVNPLPYTEDDLIEFAVTTLLLKIPDDIESTKNLFESVHKELKRTKIEKYKKNSTPEV